MSHITKVKTHLKDGLILRKALKKLGYQIEEHDLRESRKAKDLEFIARKGKVSIGFKGSGENKSVYEMLADWEAMGTRREDPVNTIYQAYSQEKIMDLARVKGYALMKNRMNEKGQIEIVLRKVG
jgi:Protein of unknown function (DUF1257)